MLFERVAYVVQLSSKGGEGLGRHTEDLKRVVGIKLGQPSGFETTKTLERATGEVVIKSLTEMDDVTPIITAGMVR